MTIREVYEKYKHMDKLLSDRDNWCLNDFKGQILLDLWQVIKSEANPPEPPISTEEDADLFVDAVESTLEGAFADPPDSVKIEKEIARLKAQNKVVSKILFDKQREMIAELTTRLDAQQQEIAELGADKVQLENDACVFRGEIERLEKALIEIRDAETECCHRCEGNGRLYADGKAHYPSENVPTIYCGDCGGSGRLQPENAQEIAEQALAPVAEPDCEEKGD